MNLSAHVVNADTLGWELCELIADDDLVIERLWEREGDRGAPEAVLGEFENWNYRAVGEAWVAHAAALLAQRGISWAPESNEATLSEGTEPNKLRWDTRVELNTWIETVIAEVRAGKHLSVEDGIRPDDAPGARWIVEVIEPERDELSESDVY